MRHFPDADTFRHAALHAQLVPVHRQLLSDHLTPVTAFEVLGRDDHAFLFENMISAANSRNYSFVGTSPTAVYLVFAGRAAIVRDHQPPEEFETTDPLHDLQTLLPQRSFHRDAALPAFTGGCVGYAGYDAARYFHAPDLSSPPTDDRRLPDLMFGLYSDVVIFDHAAQTIKVVTNADIESFRQSTPAVDDAIDAAYRDACRRVNDTVRRLQQPTVSRLGEIDPDQTTELTYAANLTREQFEDVARTARQRVSSGQLSQLSPSLRLRAASEVQPFEVYRALRVMHAFEPSYYLKSPVCALMGIASTGRAASLGSLREVLPAETVTGKPKLQAMRLLDQIEPTRRGPYGGALGYINYAGNAQMHVADRMLVWHNGSFDAQRGATIVADSVPEHSYERALAEAKALLQAVTVAERSF